jgi:hypothetical protein
MYLLSYFRTAAEALHLATSPDGFEWTALNDNDPVLAGGVGTETLRDPFLFRDAEDTYHLLATNGWASDHVVHATSGDLRSWSDQELLPVMADVRGTHNSWAPECFYDREADVYRLVWSATVDPSIESADGEEDYDHRIWTCSTPDFERFSASSCLFDPSYNVIDATVAYDDGDYLMAFKDERGPTSMDAEYKSIRLARAPSGGGPFRDVTEFVTPAPVEGPTLYRADGEWRMLYDHFLEDYYGASRSADGREWETCTDRLTTPDDVRHGSVIEIPDDLGAELRAAY